MYVADAGGNDVAVFAHGPAPETPEALAATAVTSTSAILHGELNPHGEPGKVEYHFVYSTEGTCTGAANAGIMPVPSGTLSEAKEALVEAGATKLKPSAEYAYCLVAENVFGLSELSAPQSFKTHEAPPTVLSESAFNEEEGRGRFAATINPNHSKQETTYFFEYSTSKEAVEKKEGEQAPGTGTIAAEEFGEDPATSVITTLATTQAPVEATYYYRVVATNETGTTYGEIEAYTKLPLIENESFSGLTSITAKLEATVYPNFQETTYGFEYSTSETLLKERKGTLVHGGTLPANEEPIAPIAVSVEAVALQPGKIYYYRAVAENKTSKYTKNANEGNPAGGLIEHFTTPAGPAAITGEAQNITRTSATLSGVVNPDGTETTYSFQYISETAYQAALAKHIADPYTEGETTAPVSAGSAEATIAAGPTQASGLRPEETYRYRLVATNRYGVQSIGQEATLTTTGKLLPGAVTGAASNIAQNTATLSGMVSTNGLQTNYAFEIGTETGVYGPPTGLGSISGELSEPVTVTLGELQPGTTYYYRVTATNADGTTHGEPGTFSTPGFPSLLAAPVSPPQIAIPATAFPTNVTESATPKTTKPKAKPKTRAQKLQAALKQCHRQPKKSGAKCERQAHSRYGAAKKRRK